MSITSMSARANMAQKLSIPQLQQAIQDGVIPPYVGVPLLQEKVKMAKTAQAAQAAQMAQQQPNVTQQVMAEAQQVEQGVPALPTNLPAQMAGGGIVAFAEGGMYDDEDSYENRMDAARRAEEDELMDEYAQTFQGGIGQLPAAAAAVPAAREGIAGGDAADFVAKIMHKESRGRRYGRDGELLTSEKGAKGEMQVMPGTSRDPGFGVKPARDNSPDELARVGRDYAQTLLARYGDPKLAAIAYNMGPGATDKWLAAGADVSKLPKETQGYVKGFAGGGEVKRFANGALVYNPETGMMEEEVVREGLGDKFLRAINYKQGLTAGDTMPGMTKAKEQVAAALAARNNQPSAASPDITRGRPTMQNDPRLYGGIQKDEANQDLIDARDNAGIDKMLAGYKPASQSEVAGQTAVADPYMAEFKDLFAKREANLAKQREQDKYMALLQAGLGIMGGTSQHALANIGAGATQGIQSLAEARKAATAEENALLSGRLGLAKLGSDKERADAMMQLRRDLQKDVLSQREAAAKLASEDKDLSRQQRQEKLYSEQLADLRKYYGNQALAQYKGAIATEEQKAKILADAEIEMMKRPEVRALYEKVYKMKPPGAAPMAADRSAQFQVMRPQ